MWRYAVPLVILAVLGGFFARGLTLNPAYIESPLIGKPAPEFSLPLLFNPDDALNTRDFLGQYSLLNVFGYWCEQCHYEHGFLLQLSQSGIPIYGMNWQEEDRAAVIRWLGADGNPYVKIGEDDIGDVAIDYGVYGAPETFLIAPDLTILDKQTGPMTPAVWQDRFMPAIEAHREGS